MAQTRPRVVYSCGACGAQAPRWVGRCATCGEWGTVAEEATPARPARRGPIGPRPGRHPAGRPHRRRPRAAPRPGIGELDRVLGGGLVPGRSSCWAASRASARAPSCCRRWPGSPLAGRAMLVTGEESAIQVRGRAERLTCECGQIQVLAETRLEGVLAAIEAHAPDVVAIDSVQTLHSDAVEGAPGAPNQVRAVTVELMRAAKERGRHGAAGGSGDQGRRARRPADARAPGRLRPLVRGRRHAGAPGAARHQEPLRLDQRDRASFEMRAAGLESVEDPTRLYLAEAGRARRLVRLPRGRGQPCAARRGAGAGGPHRDRARRGGSPSASTARAWPR